MNIFDLLPDLGEGAGQFLQFAVGIAINGVTEAIKIIGAWWLAIPSPTLQGESGMSPAERVQYYTKWASGIVGVLSMITGLVVVARRRTEEDTVDFVMSFFRVILVTGAVIPGTQLVMSFSDTAAPWLIEKISGGTFIEGMIRLVTGKDAVTSGWASGIYVLLFVALVVSILGSLINMAFMLFAYAALPIMVGLLPIAAAYAFTEKGRRVFDKSVGWLTATALYKLVAAVIFGAGIAQARMILDPKADAGQAVMQSLYGCVLLLVAGVALPGLIRLFAPAAAAGSRGSGGGQFLLGAAMVAIGAVTGGAAAVAGKAATGAASSQAATGAAGASGASGAGSAGASTAGQTGGSGATGNTGTSGTGTQGQTGASGSSGTNGTSGTNPSGASGETGQGTGGQTGSAPDSNRPGGASPQTGANIRAAGAHQLGYHIAGLESSVEQGDV